MTFSGAFAYFYDAYPLYTLVSRTVGSQNQTTGERIPATETTKQIKGSLDPMTEEDLRQVGIASHKEGQFRFFCEQSEGVKIQDIIIDGDGKAYRVLQVSNRVPLVNHVMGNNADVVEYHCELTRRD